MAEGSQGFRELLAGMGFPREAEEVMLAALRRAGYGSGEQEQFMGMAALTAALRVHEAATRASPRSRARAGRNDPCPCGSGRKFKKCCQGKPSEDAAEASPGLPFPLDAPDLVPRLHEPGSFAEDMDNLDRLFREDPVLSGVRFSEDEVLGFVAEEMHREEGSGDEGEAEEPDGDRPDRLEEWVARYLREVEGEEALGDLEDALVAAAPRWAGSLGALRALGLGVALASMPMDEGEPEEASPNPLHTLIFRCTLQEALETQDAIGDLIEKAGGAGAVRERLLAGGPPPLARLLEAAGGASDVPAPARDAAEEAIWSLGEDIRAGRLPVGLAFPSLLPCLARWALAEGEAGPSSEEAIAILDTSAKELGPEDAELLDQLLENWQEENREGADNATLERVAFVRSELAAGSLGPFGFDLLVAALYHRRVSGLAGEPVPPQAASTLRDALTAEFLERYGDFLWDEILPETARRTWRLCALHGPLSPALEEKLARQLLFEEGESPPL